MLEKIKQSLNHEPSNQSLSNMNVARHQIDLSYKVKPLGSNANVMSSRTEDNHLDHILVKTQSSEGVKYTQMNQEEIRQVMAQVIDTTPNAIQMQFNLKPLSESEAKFYGKTHTLKDVGVRVSRVIAKINQIRWTSDQQINNTNTLGAEQEKKSKPSM
jgi:S-adenosylmethionine synthetase